MRSSRRSRTLGRRDAGEVVARARRGRGAGRHGRVRRPRLRFDAGDPLRATQARARVHAPRSERQGSPSLRPARKGGHAFLLGDLVTGGDTTGRVYGVFGTPTVYFVDRQGNLVGRLVGARDWEAPAARKLVEELLEMK